MPDQFGEGSYRISWTLENVEFLLEKDEEYLFL
jgi:hypothetical protein